MYPPLLLKEMRGEKGSYKKLSFYKTNNELKELLTLYNNPYIRYLQPFDFIPKGQLLQKNSHKIFMKIFWDAIYKRITIDKVKEFLYNCDIHSQGAYYKILTNTLALNISAKNIDKIFPNRFPNYSLYKRVENKLYKTSKMLHFIKSGNIIYCFTRNKMQYSESIFTLKNIPLDTFYIYGEFYKGKYYINRFICDTNIEDKLDTLLNIARYKKDIRSSNIVIKDI